MRDGRSRIAKAAAVAALTVGVAVSVPAQAPAPHDAGASKAYKVPRTPWGHPDFQGIWNNGTSTPLERPADLAGREFLTDAEWAERAREIATRADRRPESRLADVELAYNNEWWDRGAPLRRTSLIIDPADGKLPALTDEGRKLLAARQAARAKRGPADSWEDRPLQERCILYHGVPPFPTGYNNNYQIAQTRDVVAVRYEMMAETRFIPLDGRPHLTSAIRQWIGNSRGRWDGDTLVVETTGYGDKTTFRFPTANDSLTIVERFTRVSDTLIDYQFTVRNPAMYTRPWTAVLPMVKAEGPMYEYACHEGNYGMAGVLSGHRAEEKAAEGAARNPR
jgi:hypothetical protein